MRLNLLLGLIVLLASCRPDPVPRPHGFFRIDLPSHAYTNYQSPCAISAEIPIYAQIELDKNHNTSDSCWMNISWPKLHGRVYCTYLPVKGNLDGMIADSYRFASKHEMKASALRRTPLRFPDHNVYGLFYDIEGEAASQVQFYLTDSTNHFFRGALYFDHKPNPDSIAPVLNFVKQDILHFVESLQWKSERSAVN
jgi:gliding motility-associated lipoprotein GldD